MSALSVLFRFGLIGVITAGAIYAIQKFMEKEEPLTEEAERPNGPIPVNVTKDCLICFDEFTEDQSDDKRRVMLQACYHFFHKSCIEQWIKQDSRCPHCRSKIIKQLK